MKKIYALPVAVLMGFVFFDVDAKKEAFKDADTAKLILKNETGDDISVEVVDKNYKKETVSVPASHNVCVESGATIEEYTVKHPKYANEYRNIRLAPGKQQCEEVHVNKVTGKDLVVNSIAECPKRCNSHVVLGGGVSHSASTAHTRKKSSKKSTQKKAAGKKSTTKKSAAKKSTTKKSTTQKATTSKSTAKKPVSKKSTASKASTKSTKTTKPKKATSRTAASKKTTPASKKATKTGATKKKSASTPKKTHTKKSAPKAASAKDKATKLSQETAQTTKGTKKA